MRRNYTLLPGMQSFGCHSHLPPHTQTQRATASLPHCNGHWSTCVPLMFFFSVRARILCGNCFHLFRFSLPLQCCMPFAAWMVHVANKLRSLTCATQRARACVRCAKSGGNCQIVSKTLKSLSICTAKWVCVCVCGHVASPFVAIKICVCRLKCPAALFVWRNKCAREHLWQCGKCGIKLSADKANRQTVGNLTHWMAATTRPANARVDAPKIHPCRHTKYGRA